VAKDYSVPVLTGLGDTDYSRYMRLNELLALQRDAADGAHPEELLFQTVHQSTELWLKHANVEAGRAVRFIEDGECGRAVASMRRAILDIELITHQLGALRNLTPAAFLQFRGQLGNGSGAESPGFAGVALNGRLLRRAFLDLIERRGIDLLALHNGDPLAPEYCLAEALIEWDERVSVWRVHHFKMATRIVGHEIRGTKGTPVDALAALISRRMFPELWEVRTRMTVASDPDSAIGDVA
jgi:tryptophan 2,3-dioxygenase